MNDTTDMTNQRETIHKVAVPTQFFSYFVATDGSFLRYEGESGFSTTWETYDSVIWARQSNGRFEHVISGFTLDTQVTDGRESLVAAINGAEMHFHTAHGPAELPSTYLATMRAQGWVSLTQIIDDAILEELERTAGTDRHEGLEVDRSQPAICQNAAVARTAAEPVSLWVIRQYMQTDDIRLSHVPGFAVLGQDDGKRNVQGLALRLSPITGVFRRGVLCHRRRVRRH